ncbi:uncharacterized protein VNE69_11170 [Vairimorpha necatrix]|uniref:Uncharacterized protein n=1 Tax=Vairimorpha necatrix TaxID=6039 RepID=A0AAX4JGE9_9MICR
MLQYLFLVVCSEVKNYNKEPDFFPKVLYYPDNSKNNKKLDTDCADFYVLITPSIKNKKADPSSSTSEYNSSYLQYVNRKKRIITLGVNGLLNIIDYKSLKQKLCDQINIWNIEDHDDNLKWHKNNRMDENEIRMFEKSKKYVKREFAVFYKNFNQLLTIIKIALNKITYDEYSDDLKDQLDFFEEIFGYLKIFTTAKNLSYKYNSSKIMEFYGNLPIRMNTFKEEFNIVDRFEIFKAFFEYKYIIIYNEIEKNAIQCAFETIHCKVKRLFSNLRKITLNSNKVVELLWETNTKS